MPDKSFSKQLLQASSIGINLVLSTFVGLAIGYGLDSLFHSSPWLTIIFLILGIIAGFRELLRLANKQDNGPDTEIK
jgi:ATP synthase protein I